MKKLLLATAILFFTGFTALFLYANLRSLSITERLEPVALVTYHLAAPDNAAEATLSTRIRSVKGVTACAVNLASNLLSVTYQHHKLSAGQLKLDIEQQTGLSLKDAPVAASGGCPVHKVAGWYHSTLDFLRIH